MVNIYTYVYIHVYVYICVYICNEILLSLKKEWYSTIFGKVGGSREYYD